MVHRRLIVAVAILAIAVAAWRVWPHEAAGSRPFVFDYGCGQAGAAGRVPISVKVTDLPSRPLRIRPHAWVRAGRHTVDVTGPLATLTPGEQDMWTFRTQPVSGLMRSCGVWFDTPGMQQ